VEFVIEAQRFILHLDFIAPPQVHTAVAAIRAVEFDVQFEIVELPRGFDVGAFLVFSSVPSCATTGCWKQWSAPIRSDLFHRTAVRIGPCFGRLAFQFGRAHSRQPAHRIAAFLNAGEFAALSHPVPR